MQDAPSWPKPPSLNVTNLRPRREPQENATEMLLGWQAARAGEPWDVMQTAGWRMGYRLWHATHPSHGGQYRHGSDGPENPVFRVLQAPHRPSVYPPI